MPRTMAPGSRDTGWRSLRTKLFSAHLAALFIYETEVSAELVDVGVGGFKFAFDLPFD